MYFPDLSPYVYGQTSHRVGVVLNVGWLEPTEVFPSGSVANEILATIARLCGRPMNTTRGRHGCGFCALEVRAAEGEHADGRRILQALRERGALGNGEIMVAGAGGVSYVAPVLVLHYIEKHGYLPPMEFLDAVAVAAA